MGLRILAMVQHLLDAGKAILLACPCSVDEEMVAMLLPAFRDIADSFQVRRGKVKDVSYSLYTSYRYSTAQDGVEFEAFDMYESVVFEKSTPVIPTKS